MGLNVSIIQPKREFVDVPRKVLLVAVVVRTMQPALEHSPHRLNVIRSVAVANVFLILMADGLVFVDVPQARVTAIETKFMEALGIYRSGALSTRRKAEGGAHVPLSLAFKNLKTYVIKHFGDVHYDPIRYVNVRGVVVPQGIRADAIPKICEVWLDARKAGVLGATQELVAEKADVLIRAFAHVGIIALVDEATGYQYERPRADLHEYLKAFIAEELRRWVKTFPNDYFKHMCRLRNVAYRPDMRLPMYFGHLTNNVVYQRLAPYVLEELKRKAPRDESGKRTSKFHQWLTEDIGHPKLLQHLGLVIGLMKISPDWNTFKRHLDQAAPNYTGLPLLEESMGAED